MYLTMADNHDIGSGVFIAQGGFKHCEEGLAFLPISSGNLPWGSESHTVYIDPLSNVGSRLTSLRTWRMTESMVISQPDTVDIMFSARMAVWKR
jgi:hypothetical protein